MMAVEPRRGCGYRKIGGLLLTDDQMKLVLHPGIFKVWRPERIEILLPESRRGTVDDFYARERGYTPVFVPDDDPDHRGTVYEDEENGGGDS